MAAESPDFDARLGLGDEHRDAGRWAEALEAYRSAARDCTPGARVWKLEKRFRALAEHEFPRPGRPARIALVGDATQDYLRASLEVVYQREGIFPTFYVAPFGQYVQEILDPGSGLSGFQPDVVLLQVRGETLFPQSYAAGTVESGSPDERLEEYAGLVRRLAERTHALVLVDGFVVPTRPPDGTPSRWEDGGAIRTIERLNAALAERLRDVPDAFVFDLDGFASRIGKDRLRNAKLWHLGKVAIDEPHLLAQAEETLRFVKPRLGMNRKVVVLDLDNTLWGGVVGELGPEGIHLAPDGAGAPFVDFQRGVLALFERGIVLAIASKNNEADAREVLEHHPSMVLRPKHFAAMQIHWNDKVESLRTIASEINVGIDSLVFLDDNPVERENVRARLPEVLVPELPADPVLYASFLDSLTDFDTLRLTDEDRARGAMYAAEKQRRDVQQSAGDLESYLRTLGTVVEVHRVRVAELPRAQQLMQKTNQFNTTTLRWTMPELTEFRSEDRRVHTAHVRDRFGDSGLVGLCLSERNGESVEIVDFLLSCRVLGRGVEDAFLRAVLAQWHGEGARRASGRIVFTPKNVPVRDLFSKNGFARERETEQEAAWTLTLEDAALTPPDWIELNTTEAESVEDRV